MVVPSGFTRFEIRETEGRITDQKYIFADDFTLATSGVGPTVISAAPAGSLNTSATVAPSSIVTSFGKNLTAGSEQAPPNSPQGSLAGSR